MKIHLPFLRKKKKNSLSFLHDSFEWKIGRSSLSEFGPSSNFVSIFIQRVLQSIFEGWNGAMIFEGWPSLEQNPMFYARKSHRLALTSRIISALNPALTRGNDARRPFIASYRVSIIPVIAAMKKEREKKKVKKDLHPPVNCHVVVVVVRWWIGFIDGWNNRAGVDVYLGNN